MPVPLSLDLRKRQIKRRHASQNIIRQIVHTSTITRLWAHYCATGSYSPRPNPLGRKPELSSEQPEQVRAAILEQPDITLQELKDKFSLPVSLPTLSKSIRNRLELYYKKNDIPLGTASGRCQNKAIGMEIRTARNGY